MKIKNVLALISATILLATSSALAGNHPARVPQIRDQAATRNYAMSIAAQGGRYAYCASMDWNYTNTHTYVTTNAAGGEQLFDRLFSTPFSYRVINPLDTVSSYAYAYDTNWTLLFYGYGSATAKDLSATNGIHTSIWMQNIPILSGVSNAQLLIFDEKGQTTETRSVDVNQYGQVVWPPWLSGYQNILLSVTYNDGDVLTYNVAKPVASTPEVVYGSDDYSIDGHYMIKSSSTNSTKGATLKIMETWNLPSAYLDLSGKQYVTLDVLGLVQDGKAYFERPVSVEVTDAQGNESTVVLGTDGPTSVLFSTGKYRLKFNWVKFGQAGFMYTGGKG